jgi:hypothetical protein
MSKDRNKRKAHILDYILGCEAVQQEAHKISQEQEKKEREKRNYFSKLFDTGLEKVMEAFGKSGTSRLDHLEELKKSERERQSRLRRGSSAATYHPQSDDVIASVKIERRAVYVIISRQGRSDPKVRAQWSALIKQYHDLNSRHPDSMTDSDRLAVEEAAKRVYNFHLSDVLPAGVENLWTKYCEKVRTELHTANCHYDNRFIAHLLEQRINLRLQQEGITTVWYKEGEFIYHNLTTHVATILDWRPLLEDGGEEAVQAAIVTKHKRYPWLKNVCFKDRAFHFVDKTMIMNKSDDHFGEHEGEFSIVRETFGFSAYDGGSERMSRLLYMRELYEPRALLRDSLCAGTYA